MPKTVRSGLRMPLRKSSLHLMSMDESIDFVRVHVMGIECVCSAGRAIAVKWAPDLAQGTKVEVPGSVFANERKYKVELLTRGIFAKSYMRSVIIPRTVKVLPEKCFVIV